MREAPDNPGPPVAELEEAKTRLLELALREHFGAETAPDLRQRILARAISEDGATTESPLEAARADAGPDRPAPLTLATVPEVRKLGRRVLRLERVVIAAGVAGLFLAGLFVAQPWNWGNEEIPPDNEPLMPAPREAVTAPPSVETPTTGPSPMRAIVVRLPDGVSPLEGAAFRVSGNGALDLTGGCLLLDGAAARQFEVNGEKIDIVGRLVLAHGGVPEEPELLRMIAHLEQSGITDEERETMMNPLNWKTGGALTVCLLAGSAVFGGQELAAQAAAGGAGEAPATGDGKAEGGKADGESPAPPPRRVIGVGGSVGGVVRNRVATYATFEQLDKDSDGSVTAAESNEEIVTKLDKNGDAKVSKEEFGDTRVMKTEKPAKEEGGEPVIEYRIVVEPLSTKAFKALDTNADWSLDAQEAGAVLSKHCDKDGNGTVGFMEWLAHVSTIKAEGEETSPLDKLFAALDGNTDGKLNAEELAKAVVDILDADKGGDVNAEEFGKMGTKGAAVSRQIAGGISETPKEEKKDGAAAGSGEPKEAPAAPARGAAAGG